MERFFFSSSPWGFRFLSLEDYCVKLKSIGIERLCFMLGPDDGFPQALKGGSENAAAIRGILAKCGVSALETAMSLDGPDDGIKLIASIGSKYLRICEIWEHTEDEFVRVSGKLNRLGKLAGEFGMTVIVENHGGLMADSKDCIRLLEKVNLDNVKLNYDAANFLHYGGEDPLEALHAVRGIIGFTHLKNVSENGFHRGTFCRISDGVIDYRPIIAELKKFYSGCLCLEYEKPEDVLSGTSDDLNALKPLIV